MEPFGIFYLRCLIALYLAIASHLSECVSFTKRPSDPSYGFVHSPVKLAWEYKLSVNESFQRLLMKRKTAQDRGAFKEMVEMENGIKHYKEFKGVVDLIGNSTLVELNLSLVDEGEYCCTVYVNLPGWKDRATSCVRLIVVVPPAISLSPQNKTVTEGDNVTLHCNATGKPKPDVTWTKLDNDHKSWRHTSKTLQFSDIKRGQGGTYRCTAGGGVSGEVSVTATIDVYYPPLVLPFRPRNVTVNESDIVTLSCNASGNPAPATTWTRSTNDTIILSNSPDLQLNITSKLMEGQYTCTANNGIGTQDRASTAIVVENYRPWKTSLRTCVRNQTVIANSTIVFNCTSDASPEAKYTFYHDDKPLTRLKRSGYYKICWIKPYQGGVYRCTPYNSYGEGESARLYLTVLHRPINTVLRTDAPFNTVIVKGLLTLNCSTQANPPVKLYQFWKENSLLSESPSAVLHIANISQSQSGVYRCIPLNDVGTGDGASVLVKVNVPARIILHPQNTTVNESNPTFLSCEAFGIPIPNITWTSSRNLNYSLPAGETLKINATRRSDAGRYTCTASNGVLGNVKSSAYLIVNYKPEIKPLRQTVESWFGHPAELSCESDSVPVARISWNVANASRYEVISSSMARSTLSLTPGEEAGFKAYVCYATNILGTSSATVRLRRLGTPKALTVNEVESTQNSIRIVWSSPERQPDERPILSYLLQYKKVEEGANLWQNISVVKNNSTVSVTVENLKIGTEYIIRIFARNIVGYSQVPTLVETSTKEYESGEEVRRKDLNGSAKLSTAAFVSIVGGAGGLFILLVVLATVLIIKRRHKSGKATMKTKQDKVELKSKHAEPSVGEKGVVGAYTGPAVDSQTD